MKNKLKKLKEIDFLKHQVSLAIVKEYKRERISHYDVKYVLTDEKLENRLRSIIISTIKSASTIKEYTPDCPEPEDDLVCALDPLETDYVKIAKRLNEIAPEEDVVSSVEEIYRAKAYLIVLRTPQCIELVAFARIPESWRVKENKGLIPLLFHENRFIDLDEKNKVFRISNHIDFIHYDELLIILSKKGFERGLNFKDGMLRKASAFYSEIKETSLFKNSELLEAKVADNQRYLRKVTTILNLGHYKNFATMEKIRANKEKWGLIYEGNQLVITEETLEDILTILQNKRLHSELTEEDFDVDSVRKFDTK